MVAAVEWDGDATAVYAANHDHPVIQGDLNDMDRVADALSKHGPFDLVQWSPPCQPHSKSNAFKRKGDEWTAVMMAAAQLIVKLRAPHYIMENVVGVMTSPEWQATQAFLR